MPEIKAAQARFKMYGVENRKLSNAEINKVAADYRRLLVATKSLPEALAHQICLMVGEKQVQALLGSPIPTPTLPTPIHGQLK